MSNKLSFDKQVTVISALAEGASIRGIERITGVHRDRGETVFDGDVEVFTVTGQSDVTRCYAWAKDHETGSNSTVVLERPPIKNALDAVRAAIVTASKRQANN